MIELATSCPVLDRALASEASDVHLRVGRSARMRVNGALVPIEPSTPSEEVLSLVSPLQKSGGRIPQGTFDDDFAFTYAKRRFRANVYATMGQQAAVLRLIPAKIRTLAELGTPPAFNTLLDRMEGLLLVTGATGDGKTTTLAAAVDYLNRTKPNKLVTLEDPAEYLFTDNRLTIDQRELGVDFESYVSGLKYALRQDPDVIVIAELRDAATMRLAVEAAETGHLVLSTLHAPTVEKAIARFIDAFPQGEQDQMRSALASASAGFLAQRLVPSAIGGRIAAFELGIAEGSIRTLIREGRFNNIPGELVTRSKAGMLSMDMSLARLLRQQRITPETANKYAVYPEEFQRILKAT